MLLGVSDGTRGVQYHLEIPDALNQLIFRVITQQLLHKAPFLITDFLTKMGLLLVLHGLTS